MSGFSCGMRAGSCRAPSVRAMRSLVTALLALLVAAADAAEADALPVLRVDAPRAIPNEPKVPGRLAMPGYRGRIGIERRGQSSQMFPKVSYAIELRRDAALLGMPADD